MSWSTSCAGGLFVVQLAVATGDPLCVHSAGQEGFFVADLVVAVIPVAKVALWVNLEVDVVRVDLKRRVAPIATVEPRPQVQSVDQITLHPQSNAETVLAHPVDRLLGARRAAAQAVRSSTPVQPVAAAAAEQEIVAQPAEERVGAPFSAQNVRATSAVEPIASPGTGQAVGTGVAEKDG